MSVFSVTAEIFSIKIVGPNASVSEKEATVIKKTYSALLIQLFQLF